MKFFQLSNFLQLPILFHVPGFCFQMPIRIRRNWEDFWKKRQQNSDFWTYNIDTGLTKKRGLWTPAKQCPTYRPNHYFLKKIGPQLYQKVTIYFSVQLVLLLSSQHLNNHPVCIPGGDAFLPRSYGFFDIQKQIHQLIAKGFLSTLVA